MLCASCHRRRTYRPEWAHCGPCVDKLAAEYQPSYAEAKTRLAVANAALYDRHLALLGGESPSSVVVVPPIVQAEPLPGWMEGTPAEIMGRADAG